MACSGATGGSVTYRRRRRRKAQLGAAWIQECHVPVGKRGRCPGGINLGFLQPKSPLPLPPSPRPVCPPGPSWSAGACPPAQTAATGWGTPAWSTIEIGCGTTSCHGRMAHFGQSKSNGALRSKRGAFRRMYRTADNGSSRGLFRHRDRGCLPSAPAPQPLERHAMSFTPAGSFATFHSSLPPDTCLPQALGPHHGLLPHAPIPLFLELCVDNPTKVPTMQRNVPLAVYPAPSTQLPPALLQSRPPLPHLVRPRAPRLLPLLGRLPL